MKKASLFQIKTATDSVAKYAIMRTRAITEYDKIRKNHTKWLKANPPPYTASKNRMMRKLELKEFMAGKVLNASRKQLHKAQTRLNQLIK